MVSSATELSCQKIQFHFLLADLLVKLADQGLAVLLGLAGPFLEDRRCPIGQLPFPLVDQRRMKSVLRGDLRHRLLSLQSLQRHFRLESRSMIPAGLAHRRRSFLARSRSDPEPSLLSSFSGPSQSTRPNPAGSEPGLQSSAPRECPCVGASGRAP